MTRTDLQRIVGDLIDEQDALDTVVATLSDEQWQSPTASRGWVVADQIGHLTYFDGTALLAIEDSVAFTASLDEVLRAGDRAETITLFRHLSPARLLEQWRTNRRHLAISASLLEDGVRIPWYGPPMSAKSFLTARLMECWAHGQDVVDAIGTDRPGTDRLRHIAQLGFITRGWTYANRKVPMPSGDVRLDLTSPSGDIWRFGLDDAEAAVTGPALDFCLVVTQRRHVDDTSLSTVGSIARDWMEKAQVYAGAPTDGPPPMHGTEVTP